MRFMIIVKASKESEAEIEIRQVIESEDFGAEFTPELRAQEERVRAQAALLAQKR